MAANYQALHANRITIELHNYKSVDKIIAVARYNGSIYLSVFVANAHAYEHMTRHKKQFPTCKKQLWTASIFSLRGDRLPYPYI